MTTVRGSSIWVRAAASSASSSFSSASPSCMICGRMLRTRSSRMVRREFPGGYICVLDSTTTSVSPASRNSSDTRRPIAGSAPLRLKATGKISQIRSKAG